MSITSFDIPGRGSRLTTFSSPQVCFSRWGLASVCDGIVVLHSDLQDPKHAELRELLLKHELNHSKGDPSWKDILHDLKDSWNLRLSWLVFWYILVRPSTWIMFSPIRPFRGSIGIDITHCLILASFFVTFISLYFILY